MSFALRGPNCMVYRPLSAKFVKCSQERMHLFQSDFNLIETQIEACGSSDGAINGYRCAVSYAAVRICTPHPCQA